MEQELVGRKKEIEILNKALRSKAPEMIAVIGRRRVGKTFLIRSVFEKKIEFELTGIRKATKAEQLQNFVNQLTTYSKSPIPIPPPSNWLQAFQMLLMFLETKISENKIVVFLDELPWLATRRSGFLKALGFFWNSWASKKNMVLVICGSAASWMIQKVIRDKGGLHNRITRRIHLEAFDLAHTALFLESIQVKMDAYQILQIYMAMGGIPHYLKEVEAGKSAIQNIDDICLSKTGLLYDEFSLLYSALFENPEEYIKIIRILADKRYGLTRKEIVKIGKLSDGGTASRFIEDLLASGFISNYYTFGKKKKEIRYRLTDEYTLFYLKFIEKNRIEGTGTWKKLSQTQTWKSWSGYAFENIGLKHIAQIKKALSIGGVYSESSVFINKGNDELPGFQIDLIIDRNDHTINLCELKFYNDEFVLSKAYAKELRLKRTLFKAATKTKKQIFITLLTTFSAIPNQHSIGLIDNSLTMDIFFEKA